MPSSCLVDRTLMDVPGHLGASAATRISAAKAVLDGVVVFTDVTAADFGDVNPTRLSSATGSANASAPPSGRRRPAARTSAARRRSAGAQPATVRRWSAREKAEAALATAEAETVALRQAAQDRRRLSLVARLRAAWRGE
jgi:hypothetical protein